MSHKIIEGFTIQTLKDKCLVNPNNIVIEAYSPKSLEGIVEILALKFPPSKANYSEAWKSLTLKMFNKLIGIYASGKITFCADGFEEAEKILKYIKGIIDEASIELERSGPPEKKELEAWSKMTAYELYNFLPKTNCGLCGEENCLAFAIKVLTGETKFSKCLPFKQSENMSNFKKFKDKYGERILKALEGE
ncbi:MAG: (Fe-S)-binding protein [Nitrososphaerota archaeon]